MEVPIYIGFGSNLGNRFEAIETALKYLSSAGCKCSAISSVFETPPWGFEEQPAFLNAVGAFSFQETPMNLLQLAMEIEAKIGRERKMHWGPRLIDIDLLAFGNIEMATQRLTIPHPMLAKRAFVLVPWAEIAGNFLVPGLNQQVQQILEACPIEERNALSKTDFRLDASSF